MLKFAQKYPANACFGNGLVTGREYANGYRITTLKDPQR